MEPRGLLELGRRRPLPPAGRAGPPGAEDRQLLPYRMVALRWLRGGHRERGAAEGLPELRPDRHVTPAHRPRNKSGVLMARRVFLSYQHRDHGRARGFDLVRHAPNLNLAYSVRHLLQAADSTNEAYIGTRIRSQMKGTSVTVVLIGANTADSDWVAK